MDETRFDAMARALGGARSRRGVAALLLGSAVAAAPLLGFEAEAGKHKKKKHKKKKKPCAAVCPDGCCTGDGQCIQPAQQSLQQCGVGGETCRSTGCEGQCPACGCSARFPCPSGQCCRGDGTCGACMVFVSSATQTGALGGLTGADATCQRLAESVRLAGTYKAWLSDGSQSPATRFTRASAPYTLVDGTVVANNWADLTSGTLRHTINLMENNAAVIAPKLAWTDTLTSGQANDPAFTCAGWTSASAGPSYYGEAIVTDEAWTKSFYTSCGQMLRLYCFQQP
ncbi:MAG: hypothetical protein QM692_17505 [Thermomicrobiales bacterium]